MDNTIDAVLDFWFGKPSSPEYDRPRSIWFTRDAEFDNEIRQRFEPLYQAVVAGHYLDWKQSATGTLALILVTDQFPRNMFRADPRAFAVDLQAQALSEWALQQGFDRLLTPIQRTFVYLPFEHAENAALQARCVELFASLENETGLTGLLEYARRHQQIIDRFGRFPHRNAVLGRQSTPEEKAFLLLPGSSF